MRAMMARRLHTRDTSVDELILQVPRRAAHAFTRAILTQRDAIAHPDPKEAAEFSYRLVISACARWTAHTIETQAPRPMTWDEMLHQLGDVIEIYVFGTRIVSPSRRKPARTRRSTRSRATSGARGH